MKKKILFVINTLGMAGAESALLDLLNILDPSKYDVSLYVIMKQGVLWHKIPESVHILNKNYSSETVFTPKGRRQMASTVLVASFKRGTVFKCFPYMCSNLADMLKKKKIYTEKILWRVLSDGAEFFDEEYDLAIAFLEGASTYYVAEHVKAKKKAAFIHVDYRLAGYTRKLDRGCYDCYDKIFPISDEVKDSFLNMYPEYQSKTEVFHNVVDTSKVLKLAEEAGGFTDDFKGIRLLTVGRLNEQKAYDIAVSAMKLIKDAGCNAKWYVLGEGKERANLEKQIKQLGLEQDFLLPGAVDNPFPYYKQTDIYVHATRYEGKSIAIQEAQTLGCVILASDCSGNREQIQDGVDGRLCPLTPEGIKDAVLDMVSHRDTWKKMSETAQKKDILHMEDIKKIDELLV